VGMALVRILFWPWSHLGMLCRHVEPGSSCCGTGPTYCLRKSPDKLTKLAKQSNDNPLGKRVCCMEGSLLHNMGKAYHPPLQTVQQPAPVIEFHLRSVCCKTHSGPKFPIDNRWDMALHCRSSSAG